MQPTETFWTTLVGDHPGIISVKFGQNPMSGVSEEVVKKVNARKHARQTTDNMVSQKLNTKVNKKRFKPFGKCYVLETYVGVNSVWFQLNVGIIEYLWTLLTSI